MSSIVTRLHQVSQRAHDLDRAVAFYRDVVGCPFIARFDPPGLAFFDLGNTRLLLEAAAPSVVLYLEVPDIAAAHQALVAARVVIVADPHRIHRDDAGRFGPVGSEEWMAFFRDSEDNLLALVERRAAS
jgi:methylmalonyl-CoA/ethylmalonyl-CoA epimerase